MNKSKEKVFHCNVELTLDIIAGKWKPLILHHIGNSDPIRYGELKRKIPNINQRVLSRQLRELEKDKLIKRNVYDEVPLRVEYSVTKVGASLTPILNALGNWGIKYNQAFNYGKIYFENQYDTSNC